MAPLVHNKTADCKRENKGRRRGEGEWEEERRRGERWLKPDFMGSKGLWQRNNAFASPILAEVKLGTPILDLTN